MLKQFVPRGIRTKLKSALGLRVLSNENRGQFLATTARQQGRRSMKEATGCSC